MSIEAMKQALATIEKIIDGCNNVQEEKDIHGDAKTLAKLIKKDCFPTLEALRQAIAEAEKQEAVAWMWKDGTLTSDPDFADGTWTPLFAAPVHASDISQKPVDETAKDRHKPVAFRNIKTGEFCTSGFLRKDWAKWQPLYTAPVACDDDIYDVWKEKI